MDEASVRSAEERLARAKARMAEVRASATFSWDEFDAADEEELAAERELAAAKGQEYARALPLDVKWDLGAPKPFVISNGSKAAVVFYLSTKDQAWDGTYVTVVDPGSPVEEPLGVIEFEPMYDIKFGGLNDEAIEGHPLWGKGLDTWAVNEVVGSRWIAESERRNSVHRNHRGGWHERMKHYILCFHDEMLECLADDIRVSRVVSSYSDAVSSVTARLLRRG